jgi:hypothetical protein
MADARPLLVIGDVHGCSDELARLFDEAKDRDVVLVGDLVGKGPDPHGVLALVRDRNARAVVGNHDRYAIRLHRDLLDGKEVEPKADHRLTMSELDDADWALLESLPFYLELPEHRAIVVHAGLVPGVALADQDREHLLTLRSFDDDGRPSKRIEGVPWASRWRGPELVFFGHDAVRGLQRYPHAVGLDTGCVYGGSLSGFLLPEHEITSVHARRAYSPAGHSK